MTDTMSNHHPEPEDRSASTRSNSPRNGNTITCGICHAVYAPVQVHEYLLQAPRVALESAFMSMCHFCFRCRRPACPSCWDYVHGVCGACALEARLPFRSPSTPLQGVLFPAIRQAQSRYKRAPQARLTCIRPGKFHDVSPFDSIETTLTSAIATENTPHQTKMPDTTPEKKPIEQPRKKSLSTPPPVASSAHIDIVEIATKPEPPRHIDIDEIVTKPEPPRRTDIDEIITLPEPPRHSTIHRIATKPEPPRRTDIDEIITLPARPRRIDIDRIATKPEPRKHISTDELVTGSGRSIRRRIERVTISILLTLLVFIVVIVIFATVSQDVDTIILKTTSIDIRVEIAYILQLVRQVFS